MKSIDPYGTIDVIKEQWTAGVLFLEA